QRGCKALNASGGVTSIVIDEGMARAPGFRFRTATDAYRFAGWSRTKLSCFQKLTALTSRYCRLVTAVPTQEGNHCFVRLQFDTGEAAGQNMVTFATAAICNYIDEHSPVHPEAAYVEGNFSSDKKASLQSLAGVRGKKVTAEARLDAETLRDVLKCSAHELQSYWTLGVMGAIQTGIVGIQGHYANVLAGIYTALGQDVACVAESAVGITRFTQEDDGIYACVTLPNLVVGSVGGGTQLPDQARYFDLMGLPEVNRARALAEVIGAVCLAGELSIAASLAAGSFADAHRCLGRKAS
ncbi:MAG: hypothetical protein V3U43_04435, partial [Pseudomonadales bacterium]